MQSNSLPITKRSTFWSVSFLFVYKSSTICPFFPSSNFMPSAYFMFSSALPKSWALALVLASCDIESINEVSKPYANSACLRFLFEMEGVSTMIGRINGTIHLVRKTSASFSGLVLTSMTADAPKSSHLQTLAMEKCHPRHYEWWAMTENLGPVHLKLQRSLREQTKLIPHKLASSATCIARISLWGNVWFASRRHCWISNIGRRTRAKQPEKDSGL